MTIFDDRIAEIQRMIKGHQHFDTWNSEARLNELKEQVNRLARSLASISRDHTKSIAAQRTRIEDLEKTVTEQRRTIFKIQQVVESVRLEGTQAQGRIFPRLRKLEQREPTHFLPRREEIKEPVVMLRVVRANGARFKVRSQDLPHIVLYNGDRVERA